MLSQVTRFSRFSFLQLALLCLVVTDAARAQDTTILPQAQVGKPYAISIGVDTENGKGQLTWKLAHGDLPPGLQVSTAGRIEGTPTDTKSDPYVFELSVSDSSQPPQSAVLRFSIVILSAPLRIKSVNVATTQLKVLGVSAVDAASGASISARARAAVSDPAPVSDPAAAPTAGPPAAKPRTSKPATDPTQRPVAAATAAATTELNPISPAAGIAALDPPAGANVASLQGGSAASATIPLSEPSEEAKKFTETQSQIMADEKERNRYRNPNLVITPIRKVFGPTEVGEKEEADIAVSIKRTVASMKILYIKPSTRENPEAFPEDFSLIQPDLQCPFVATSEAECHLRVQYHPAREGVSFAYVNIISEVTPESTSTDPNPTPLRYYDYAYLIGYAYVSNIARLNGTGPLSNHPGLRSVMGFDVSGASNAQTQQKFFLEFDLNAPVGFARRKKVQIPCKDYFSLLACKGKGQDETVQLQLERRDPLSRPLWFFLNPRITSVPQSPTPLGSLNIQSISDSITGNNNTTSLVQGLDVHGGIELFLIRPRQGLPFWSVVKNAHARIGLAAVGAAGFTTPFSPPDKSTQEFTINPTILAQFPKAASPQKDANGNNVTPTIIAFVDKDRTRFFRRYYAGLRFKTYFFSDRVRGECDDPRLGDRCEGLINLFPGVVDLTAGKDEAVTGGHFSDWVFRLDAVYPLPFIPAFHIFGGANVVLGKNTTTLPLTLEPPPTFLNFSDPHVFVQALDPQNRDTYRIGLGVDLLQVIKSKLSKPPAASEAPASETPKDAKLK